MEPVKPEELVRASDVYHRLGRMEALVEAYGQQQVQMQVALSDVERRLREEFCSNFTSLKETLEKRVSDGEGQQELTQKRVGELEKWRSQGLGRSGALLWIGGAVLTMAAALTAALPSIWPINSGKHVEGDRVAPWDLYCTGKHSRDDPYCHPDAHRESQGAKP